MVMDGGKEAGKGQKVAGHGGKRAGNGSEERLDMEARNEWTRGGRLGNGMGGGKSWI